MALTPKQRDKFIEQFRQAFTAKNYRQVHVIEDALYALGFTVAEVTELSQLGWRFAVLKVG